tara:strand:- start:42 stop:251 length:210 start_codon:yes stop_codon:yes gene_type:complete
MDTYLIIYRDLKEHQNYTISIDKNSSILELVTLINELPKTVSCVRVVVPEAFENNEDYTNIHFRKNKKL